MGGDIGVLLTSNSTRDPIWACPAAVVPGRQQAEHADRPAVSAETARPRKGRPGGLRTSANVTGDGAAACRTIRAISRLELRLPQAIPSASLAQVDSELWRRERNVPGSFTPCIHGQSISCILPLPPASSSHAHRTE